MEPNKDMDSIGGLVVLLFVLCLMVSCQQAPLSVADASQAITQETLAHFNPMVSIYGTWIHNETGVVVSEGKAYVGVSELPLGLGFEYEITTENGWTQVEHTVIR